MAIQKKIATVSICLLTSACCVFIFLCNDGHVAQYISEPHYMLRHDSGKNMALWKHGVKHHHPILGKNETRKHQNSQNCYRQVQVWMGAASPKQPQKIECPEQDCRINYVKDRSYETFEKSDAVVFYHLSHWDWGELQKRRRMNQAWIFYSLESPPLTGAMAIPPKGKDKIYNYTMSYRPSSTIHCPYGMYNKGKPKVFSDHQKNWAEGKTRLVAWASSKCRGRGKQSWRRLEFVNTLAKYLSVDMYGFCGNKKCDRFTEECWDILRSHKFYLSLENNECRDYITEKFWNNALLQNIVPIVYGPPREDYERVAPPNSFIHLQDFKTFEELVDYIRLLDSNDTLYNKYFEWKLQGSVSLQFIKDEVIMKPHVIFCKIASLLVDHEKNITSGQKEEWEHPSIYHHWSKSCIKPTGFPHDF